MAHHTENENTEKNEKEVDITPSETKEPTTGDPGRTPGKAEGEDDSSATE